MTNRIFEFKEPHQTGGVSTVTITEDQIIEFMDANRSVFYSDGIEQTEEEMVDDFMVVNSCKEKIV